MAHARFKWASKDHPIYSEGWVISAPQSFPLTDTSPKSADGTKSAVETPTKSSKPVKKRAGLKRPAKPGN